MSRSLLSVEEVVLALVCFGLLLLLSHCKEYHLSFLESYGGKKISKVVLYPIVAWITKQADEDA